MIFTLNASGGIKLVEESYPFELGSHFVLASDNHNSVNGVRECAKEVVAAQQGRAFSICASNGGDAGKQAVADFWEGHHEAFLVDLPGNKSR